MKTVVKLVEMVLSLWGGWMKTVVVKLVEMVLSLWGDG